MLVYYHILYEMDLERSRWKYGFSESLSFVCHILNLAPGTALSSFTNKCALHP